MTVGELIERLGNWPSDARVAFDHGRYLALVDHVCGFDEPVIQDECVEVCECES